MATAYIVDAVRTAGGRRGAQIGASLDAIGHDRVRRPMQALDAANAVTPAFDWRAFFTSIGVNDTKDFSLSHPKYFAAMQRELAETPVKDWQAYLRWHLVNGAAANLSKRFVDADFAFTGTTFVANPTAGCRNYAIGGGRINGVANGMSAADPRIGSSPLRSRASASVLMRSASSALVATRTAYPRRSRSLRAMSPRRSQLRCATAVAASRRRFASISISSSASAVGPCASPASTTPAPPPISTTRKPCGPGSPPSAKGSPHDLEAFARSRRHRA